MPDSLKSNTSNTSYAKTASMTTNGSNDIPNKYEIKRFSKDDTKGKAYLFNFYKYIEGGIFGAKTVRVPECSFENYISKESAYNEILKMTNNKYFTYNPVYDVFGELINDDKVRMDDITPKFDKLGDILTNNNVKDIIPYNYIIFAIDGNKVEGFFVGNCIFNKEDIIFISTNSNQSARILHNNLNVRNVTRMNNYLLTNVEIEQYLQNKNSNPKANEIFKGRWLVFRLLDDDNCKASIDASTLEENKNTGFSSVLSKFSAGSRSRKSQRKHKSKKYARKTIRKHKSRKNRN